jgi:predicted  nucleic acid-binding Zn-ribbon protein
MARALKEMLTLCLALGLTSFAWGQGQFQPSVLGPVLSNPEVQKELKLSEEQIGKLKDALNKVIEKYKDDFAKLQKMSPEEQQKKMRSLIDDSHKAMAGILEAKQMKRLKQIEWQIAGVNALQDPDLQKELKLSDEQKKKLDGLFTDANKKVQQLLQTRETSREKYEAVVKELEEKANGLLNEEQQKNLKESKGPKFDFSPPATPKSGK